jgi:hypothetical protein
MRASACACREDLVSSFWGFGDGYEWSYHTSYTQDGFERWMGELRAYMASGGGPVASLVFVRGGGEPPPARARATIAELIASSAGRRFAARVLVSEDLMVRMIVRGVDWLAPPHFPSAVFDNGSEAFAWLRVRTPHVRLDTLRAQILQNVPPEVLGASKVAPPRHFSLAS